MIKRLVVPAILLWLMMPTALWTLVDFTVNVRRSATGAPDSVDVSWVGYDTADSLAVWYDLNSYPDGDSIGVNLLWSTGIAARDTTILKVMPEGVWLYFTLMEWDGADWTQANTVAERIQDFAFRWPRCGMFFPDAASMSGEKLDSLSTYDLIITADSDFADDNIDIAHWDTVRQYNPDAVLVAHGYADSWQMFTGDLWHNDDPAAVVLSDSMEAHIVADSLDYYLWTAARGTILESVNATSNHIWINVQDDVTVPFSVCPDWANQEDVQPHVILFDDSPPSVKYEIMRVEDVRRNAGTDSIKVARPIWQSAPDPTWAFGDSIFVCDNHIFHDEVCAGNGSRSYLLGAPDYRAIRQTGRIHANVWGGIQSDRGVKTINGFQNDNYYRTNFSHRANPPYTANWAMDDSSWVYLADSFRDQADADGNTELFFMGNMVVEALVGMESGPLSGFMMGEDDSWTSAHRYSTHRDIVYERIAEWLATRYRYGMKSDNWPGYLGCKNHDGAVSANNVDRYRFDCALATVFDLFPMSKKAFDPAEGIRWMDEFWVDRYGRTAFDDSVNADRWWLGVPIEPREQVVFDTVSVDLCLNGGFETNTVGWSVNNADSIVIAQSAVAAHAGSFGLSAVINSHYHQLPSSGLYTYYDYLQYADAGMDLIDNSEYTVRFWIRSGETGANGLSRLVNMRLMTTGPLYSCYIHVPQTWTEIALPIYIDTDRVGVSDLQNAKLQFGLTPQLWPDSLVQTLYLDDVRIEKGVSFAGYSRQYQYGWIGINMRHTTAEFSLPANHTWTRIRGYNMDHDPDRAWSDSIWNNGSTEGSSVTLQKDEAIFLFRSDRPTADQTTPLAGPVVGSSSSGQIRASQMSEMRRSSAGE